MDFFGVWTGVWTGPANGFAPAVGTWLWNVFSSAGGGQTHVFAGQDFKLFVSRHS